MNPRALTDDQVAIIRQILALTRAIREALPTKDAIADAAGVSRRTIEEIDRGTAYKDVPHETVDAPHVNVLETLRQTNYKAEHQSPT